MNQDYKRIMEENHGALRISQTNDYLFKALMQENNKVLKAVICSVLRIDPELVRKAEITNPIILGETIDNKLVVLDVNVDFNSNTVIDLEMQVCDEGNWEERCIYYLGRIISNLQKGGNYVNMKNSLMISFMDFTMFKDHPEFRSEYRFANVKTGHVFSSKTGMFMVDLTQIRLAQKADKTNGLERWASFFKANSWEDIEMISQNDEIMQEAVVTIKKLSDDERIRQQCEARDDYNRRQRDQIILRERVEKELAITKEQLRNKDEQLRNQNEQLRNQNEQLQNKDEQLQNKDEQLRNQNEQLQNKNEQLKEKDALIAELQAKLDEKNNH